MGKILKKRSENICHTQENCSSENASAWHIYRYFGLLVLNKKEPHRNFSRFPWGSFFVLNGFITFA